MPATPAELGRLWTLDPEVDFLNHGSFGACPRPVLEEQARLRGRLERGPVRFFVDALPGLLDEARAALAAFLGADPEGLAFVRNATSGVNTVLRSLRLEPGDELLVSDHEYNASRNALDFAAERTGARVVEVSVPFPLAGPDAVVEAFLGGVTDRTRLALFDHVTSPTGLVLPAARLVAALRERGVESLVDAAHAPGMLDLDLEALGAAYYTGNCHKWVCTPKGSAFLYVRADRRDAIRPLAISHGANAPTDRRTRFRNEFDWGGTDDPTPWLVIPAAIELLGGLLPGGWPALRARNRALALEARALLGDALGVAPPCPDAMIGSLATLPLPPRREPLPAGWDLARGLPLHRRLLERGIEVPVFPWPALPGRALRVSAQVYNARPQYERLAAALGELLVDP